MKNNDLTYVEFSKETMPSIQDLKGDLREVAEIIGVPKALKLAQRFRGIPIWLRNLDSIIRKQRNHNIRKDYDEGIPVTTLCRRYKLSDRQMWKILGSLE